MGILIRAAPNGGILGLSETALTYPDADAIAGRITTSDVSCSTVLGGANFDDDAVGDE